MSNTVKCEYSDRCASKGDICCTICKNNTMRNYVENFFKEADDNPIPASCPPLRYDGPAEQTAGYKCPVCGGFTNPYQLNEEKLCSHCGYRLNVPQ